MLLQILSDAHLEKFGRNTDFDSVKIEKEADFVGILGDIHVNVDLAFEFFNKVRSKTDASIIFIAGNHDFEELGFAESLLKIRELSSNLDDFYFLDNEMLHLKGVNFYGSTLWPNFELNGVTSAPASKIAVSAQDSFKRLKLSIGDIESMHKKGVDSLRRAVSKVSDLIVLTHFAPSRFSLSDKYKDTVYSPYFASDLELYTSYVKLWCHGHTHVFKDYELGCRIVSNPLHDSLLKNPFLIEL